MKTFYFNVQAKGGAGKSMLTYLQALKHEEYQSSVFVDFDASTKTSTRQLAFLLEKDRLLEVAITDSIERIDREKLFQSLEELAELPFSEYYLDFGAPESEQLPKLFTLDFSAEEFKEFETTLEARFVFNVVIAGGPAYLSCMDYLQRFAAPLKGAFDIYALINEFSFQAHPELIDEAQSFIGMQKGLIKGTKLFGNISVDRNSGRTILEAIAAGKGMPGHKSFAAKTVIRRELGKL